MKELLQQKAEAKYPYIPPRNGLGEIIEAKAGQNPPDYKKFQKLQTAFLAGAKEIFDNPELYGLVKKDKYDELDAFHNDLHSEYATLQVENKELKEEIERLTKVCNGCFETIHNKSVEIEKLKAGKLNKSNY